jgi:cation diffusion facilitator CzcD-associated flavoprotein CzcO
VTGLVALERQVQRDLAYVAYPARPWPEPRTWGQGAPLYDVVIVGAGQGGLATAFALQRERVRNVLVVDASPAGAEGPWVTFARMRTLRTPKHVTGPDLGIPSLTFQAWYEAQHGAAAWAKLGQIPREQWMAYLSWYRRVLDLPIENETRVERIVPEDDVYCLQLDSRGTPRTLHARLVVLATGIEASGAWYVPPFIRVLPQRLWAHTADPIDFAALRGKRVGVLGAGASAFDNAATALEHGAAEVRLYYRRSGLPRVNPYRWMEFTGFLKHFGDLDDALRWRFMRHIISLNQPPTEDACLRAAAFPAFHQHAGADWLGAAPEGAGVRVETTRGPHTFDFLFIGTGFLVDLHLRPELAALADDVALWRDRYTPPPEEADPLLAAWPYLGPHFEFAERVPGAAPHLRRLFNFTFGATLSDGLGGGSISGLRYGVPRLLAGLTRELFLADADHYYHSLAAYADHELSPAVPDEIE